ncbi:MAG: hypothetical protein J0M33_13505 [Anaerolineae bacterium]|nr:hypothetical protein [Anaerolineae bacterium]
MVEYSTAKSSIDSWENITIAQTEEIDLKTLATVFEDKWRQYRKERILLTEDDGHQREFAIYSLPVDEHRVKAMAEIIEFTRSAMLLGYRSAIGTLALPISSAGFLDRNQKEIEVLFFLERLIKP